MVDVRGPLVAPHETYVTIAELMDRWKVSKRYVEKLLYTSRQLPYLKLGNRTRIALSAVERFEQDNTHPCS